MCRLLPILLCVVLVGCAQQPTGPAAPVAAGSADPPKLTRVTPRKARVRRPVELPGAVFAFEETTLVAKVPGFVRQLHADIGKAVKSGDLLVEVDVPELVEEAKEKQALVRLAEAQTEQARKALAAAEAGVGAAEAMVAEARAGLGRVESLYARWDSESRRITELARGGVLDVQTRDETQHQFRAAAAARDEVKAKVTSAEAGARKAVADRDKAVADVTAAEAKRDVAQAETRRLEALLGYTRLRAPFDGVVTRRLVHRGDFLSATGKASGTFTIAQLDPVRVVIDVPENEANLVRVKLPVTLTVQALGGVERKGEIARTSSALEPNARTLRAEVDLPNPDHLLRPGMYVYARLAAELEETWTVPAAAITKQGDAQVCFRNEGGKAVRTVVKMGRSDGQLTQVLRLLKGGSPDGEPLTGGETFLAPAAGLTDGQDVNVP